VLLGLLIHATYGVGELATWSCSLCLRADVCYKCHSSSQETYFRATERHPPYGITQCYLPPDTGERAPPWFQPDRPVLD